MSDHLSSALAQLRGSADWNKRTGGTLSAKLTPFEAQGVLNEITLLEAQITATKADNEKLRATLREGSSIIIKYGELIESLQQRLAAAQADSRRLDWALTWSGETFFHDWREFTKSDDLPTRAAIDAAMQQEAAP